MQFQHKRALERQLAKDGGLGWNKAKTAISIMARALERWGYCEPAQETKENLTSPMPGTERGIAAHTKREFEGT